MVFGWLGTAHHPPHRVNPRQPITTAAAIRLSLLFPVLMNEPMRERIVITGATGFIGTALLQQLKEEGYHVSAVVRAGSAKPPLADEAIEWTTDVGALVQEIARFEPNAIFHLATHFIAQHSTADVNELIQSNVLFGTAVMEAAANTEARAILTGSSWQHVGGNDYSPVSLYAATKQALWDIALAYAADGLDVQEVAFYDTYGPGDARRKLIPVLLDAAISGETLEMSSGEQLINLLYRSDAVSALMAVLEDRTPVTPGARFVARVPQSINIRDVVKVLERAADREIRVRWGARPNRPREMTSDWVFGSLVPNWSPQVDLAEGLRRCWDSRMEQPQ